MYLEHVCGGKNVEAQREPARFRRHGYHANCQPGPKNPLKKIEESSPGDEMTRFGWGYRKHILVMYEHIWLVL